MSQGSHARAVVVGGRGFIGSHLVEALSASGTPVTVLGRDDPPVIDGSAHPSLMSARTVYWAASSINPLIASEHPELVAADRRSFERFLHALETAGAACRVVLLSSGGTVYGRAPTPHRETTPPAPDSAYGFAKLDLEQLLAERRPDSVSARISNAYGPGQRATSGQGVVAHWLQAVVDQHEVAVYGRATTTRDYVYVSDVADALNALHSAPTAPSVLNIGSGRPTTLDELAAVVDEAVTPRTLRTRIHPARPFDIPASWLDVSLAHRTLGWSARTTLRDGVRRTWQHVTGLRDRAQLRTTIT